MTLFSSWYIVLFILTTNFVDLTSTLATLSPAEPVKFLGMFSEKHCSLLLQGYLETIFSNIF